MHLLYDAPERCLIMFQEASSACRAHGQWEQCLLLVRDAPGSSMFLYDRASAACRMAGRWDLCLQLLEDAPRDVADVKRLPNLIETASMACSFAGEWEWCLRLLEDAHVRSDALKRLALLRSASIAAGSRGRLDRVFEIWEREPRREGSVMVDVSQVLRSTGNWPLALSLWDGIRRGRGRPKSVKASSAELLSLEEASRQWNLSPEIAYRDVGRVLNEGRKYEEAVTLLEAFEGGARSSAMSVDGYAVLMAAHGGLGHWEQALGVLGRMRRRSVEPDQLVYSGLADAFGTGLQWQRAISVLDMHPEGMVPSHGAYTFMIAGCTKCGEWEQALHLLTDMKVRSKDIQRTQYNAVILACTLYDEKERAAVLMRELAELPELGADGASYAHLISGELMPDSWKQSLPKHEASEEPVLPAAAGRENVAPSSVPSKLRAAPRNAVTKEDKARTQAEQKEATARAKADVKEANALAKAQEKEEKARAKAAEKEAKAQTKAAEKKPQKTAEAAETEEHIAVEEKQQAEALPAEQDEVVEVAGVTREQLEGAAALYREAIALGAFKPWLFNYTILDLHGMNSDVGKVAVYDALLNIQKLPADDPVMEKVARFGLKILVGRGLHSDGGKQVLAPAVLAIIRDIFGLHDSYIDEFDFGGNIRVPISDIRLLRGETLTDEDLQNAVRAARGNRGPRPQYMHQTSLSEKSGIVKVNLRPGRRRKKLIPGVPKPRMAS